MLAKEWRSLSFEEQMSYSEKIFAEELKRRRENWEWTHGLIERTLKKRKWYVRLWGVVINFCKRKKKGL